MSKAVEVYGIKSCDTMKKARAWLDAKGVIYTFHDYKAEGIDAATLKGWVELLGWEVVLNRSGSTFRALPDSEKGGLTAARAIALMVKQPAMIKRPILVAGHGVTAGFKTEAYAAIFG